MPLKGVVTPIDEPVEFYYSSPDNQTIGSLVYTIENDYKQNDFKTESFEIRKMSAPPPFMNQAAGADFQPLGHSSTIIECSDCGSRMPSRVFYKNGTKTHLIALVMCCIGLWCCVPLPYFLNSCRTANHYCGNCHHYLGSYPIGTKISG